MSINCILELNKENLLGFFTRRPNGVSAALIEDTAGLDNDKARGMIAELVKEGVIIIDGDLYKPSSP